MTPKDSATDPSPVAFGLAGTLRQLFAWLARGWRDTVYLHGRLMEWQRPWEQHGPLRWRRELGGTRLIGSQLPGMGDQ
jgi:hypothetical protein